MEGQTTIEQYLRNKLTGYSLSLEALQDLAESPADVGLEPFELTDLARPYPMPADFIKRRDYAESCLYYLALGIFSGGGISERIGDVSYSSGSYTVTKDDRTRYQALADSLRKNHGFPVLETDDSEIEDGSHYVDMISR